MGLMDNLKGKLGMAREKAGSLNEQHGNKVDSGLDQAGRQMDSRTGGKHGKHIRTGVEKAKETLAERRHKGGGTPGSSA